MNTFVTIGIAIGVLYLLGAAAFLIIFFYREHKKEKDRTLISMLKGEYVNYKIGVDHDATLFVASVATVMLVSAFLIMPLIK